ncbi:pyridoxine/pyridoxamine 5'-phosphate oxidase [bacterium MnTg02]|nr:pyridoxine/pyridoxamine 5'-phosphate oxidase [bacterium MnTg02]
MTDTKTQEFYSGPQAGDFSTSDDPFALFDSWMSEAIRHEINDPNAMALATVDSGGLPNVRMVLLKEATPNGFVFYTNLESAKGQEILANPKASLCFHWKSLRRQVRIRGDSEVVDDSEADSYFASRSRGSRLGAWASQQSRPLESRFALEKSVAKYTAKYGIGKIPRPPYWSGFCLIPQEIEFWHDRPFRLHDRIVFRREDPRSLWSKTRLYP